MSKQTELDKDIDVERAKRAKERAEKRITENQEGLEDLRQSIHQLLFDQALYCKADQLVLTSGTQQALFILSQISFLAKPRKSWWNSRPTIE